MSVRQCIASMSSHEFAEWIAFYALEAQENDPDRPPTTEELSDKFAAFAAMHR